MLEDVDLEEIRHSGSERVRLGRLLRSPQVHDLTLTQQKREEALAAVDRRSSADRLEWSICFVFCLAFKLARLSPGQYLLFLFSYQRLIAAVIHITTQTRE